MDHKIIAHIDLRQITVNSEFITVLTETSGHIIYMIARRILLTKDRNMMISTVNGRTHQVCCTRIYTDVFLIDMLLMDCLRNETAIRSEHESSHLGIDSNIAHSSRNKYFIICFMNALTDHTDIVRLLVRCVRNSNTTGEVYETYVASGLVAQLNNQFK